MLYRVIARLDRTLELLSAWAAVAALAGIGFSTASIAGEGDLCLSCTDARRAHLGDLLGEDPSFGRMDGRLDDKPWIARDWASLPVAVKPVDQKLDMAASLQHLGSYEDQRTAKKLEEARAMAPAGLALPKLPPALASPFDVWSKVEVKGLEGEAGEQKRGTVGADYRIARSSLVGVAAAIRDQAPSATPAIDHDTRLAAYFVLKPWSPLTFDARAQWGESRSTVVQGLVTTQSAITARLKGDFKVDGLRFAPVVSVARGIDEPTIESGGTAVEKSTLSVVPRVSRPFEVDGLGKIEPYLSLKSAMDVTPSAPRAGPATTDTTRGVGAGVTLARPNAYSLSVTTDVEQSSASEHTNLKGRLELKVPLH